MKKILFTLTAILLFTACDLLNPPADDPNVLGGDPNLEITKPGYVSYTYLTIDGNELPSGRMTVESNTDGVVVYKIKSSLVGYPDSAKIAVLLSDKYLDGKGNIVMDFKFKITTEGIQDYFRRDRPWTLVKFNDGVGTEYPFTTDNGTKQVRKITEKTGKDEWPMGLWLIKTTKIEQDLPESDKTAKKVIYRANHKYGLVYVEMLLKNGQTMKLDIMP
jgi:hypothetical protein